jgi:hypothetical protein
VRKSFCLFYRLDFIIPSRPPFISEYLLFFIPFPFYFTHLFIYWAKTTKSHWSIHSINPFIYFLPFFFNLISS